MKMEIVKDKKNPAMKRDEHIISLEHKGKATPSRHEIMKEVAKLLKAKEDLIIVDKIISNKGVQSSMVYVLSYRKKDDVPKYKLEKMNARMEKAKARREAAKEKAAEAAPKEEAKPEDAAETGEQAKEEEPAEEPKQEEEAKEGEQPEEAAEEEKKEEAPAEEKPAETGEGEEKKE
jgi:ribosomal protein S24E